MSSLAAKMRSAQMKQSGAFLDAFAYEAKQEAATALGIVGKQLEEALAALKRHDETPGANADRALLVWEAADRAMALIIQREAFGLRASSDVQKFYGVPAEVMAKIGTTRP